jgi:hypothetical protein
MQWFVHDPYAATILYRVLAALAASVLVLAVLRRLLTPGIALGMAIWWAVNPANFDDLYEVHLFALVPELGAVLLACALSGPRMRPIVLGAFLASGLLMRNETLVAALAWLAIWLVWEWNRRRRGEGVSAARLARAVVIPIAVIVVVEGLVVVSDPQRGQLSAASSHKHRFNFCQIYAYGYQQRNDDFPGDPWRDCRALMERKFGREDPTLTEAFESNPGAVAGHFFWNARITPAALQLMLFDRTSEGASHDPDYIPVRSGSSAALIGSIVVIAFCLSGLILVWRDRRRWWERWIRARAWGWAALAALALSNVVVMIVARPRPEFVFGFTPFMLAVIGMAAMAYVERFPALGRFTAVMPAFAIVVLIAVPKHYGPRYETPLISRTGQPLRQTVDRLQPWAGELRGGDVGLLASYGSDACHYIGREDPCNGLDWFQVVGQPGPLDQHGVNFVYVDREDMRNPSVRAIVDSLSPAQWQRVGPPLGQGWTLFRRASTAPPNATATSSPT